MKRLITLVTVIVAVAAILVPVGSARVALEGGSSAGPLDPWTLNLFARQDYAASQARAANSYTPAQLENMALTWQAKAKYSYYTPAQLDNLAKTWQAKAKFSVANSVPTTTDDGVSGWNIGIGAGSGFFALLLGAGLVAMTRRSRRQQPVHA